MAELNLKQITDKLNSEFTGEVRKLIFWYDMDTVVGSVVQNPNNPNLWGIRNESKDNWTYIKPDGIQLPVANGRSAAIAKDAKICFGQFTGEFR